MSEIFLDELRSAVRCNGAPFTMNEVDSVEPGFTIDHGDYAEKTISGVVVLTDGRRFLVEGSCDTTGWECRSSLDCVQLS